jgi:hypothetical protein
MRKLGYLATPYLIFAGCVAIPVAILAACGDDDDGGTVDSGPPRTDAGGGTMDAGGGGMDAGDPGMDAGETPMGEDFVLEAEGDSYAPHNGQTLTARVFDSTDTSLGEGTAMVEGGMFEITIAGVIEDGEDYTARWWVDSNMMAGCQPDPAGGGGDHQWELEGMGTATGLTITHMHDIDWTDVCDSF